MYNIHLLPARFGDSILIEYGTAPHLNYILIDGGPYFAFEEIMENLNRLAPNLKKLELLVVTHIDIDHIDGIIRLLNQPTLPFEIGEIWFNGYGQLKSGVVGGSQLGALQGEYLSRLISGHGLKLNGSFSNRVAFVENPAKLPRLYLDGGFEITLLTPSKKALQKLRLVWEKEIKKIEAKESVESRWENDKRYGPMRADVLGEAKDSSAANLSSIAFLGTYEGKTCLFAGDSPSAELLPGIKTLLKETGDERLRLDAWKLAHHGSKRSTHKDLIEKVEAKHILVSSDGKRFKLPDKECIESILLGGTPGLQLHFNYLTQQTRHWQEASDDFSAHYPADPEKAGISVQL